jgi:hypothetical protein
MIQTTEAGDFLTVVEHDKGKILSLWIYPIVDDLVYPLFSMQQKDFKPLADKIESLIQ